MTERAARVALGKHYRKINARAYDGRLPERVEFLFETRRGALAEVEFATKYDRDCRIVRRRVLIAIDPRLLWSLKLILRELLHEVVHVARPDMDHGPEFEDEMIRVRRALGGDQLW